MFGVFLWFVYLFIIFGLSLFTPVQTYLFSLTALYYFSELVQSVLMPKLIADLGY